MSEPTKEMLSVSGTLHWVRDDEGRGWWELETTGGDSFPPGTTLPCENLWAGHDGDRFVLRAEFVRRSDG
jgi:hypothetical protein